MADYPDYPAGGGDSIYGFQNFGAGPDYKLADPSLQPTPDAAPTLNDHWLNMYGATMQTLAGVRRGVAQMQPDDESRKAYDLSANDANNKARDALEQMTPAGRDTASRWNKHWVHGALMGLEQQAPSIGAAGVAEAVGGPAAAAGVYGALSAGQAADNFYQAVANEPEDKLMQNKDYADMVNSGMSRADAREQFAHNHINDAEQMLIAGATGMGVGYLGPAAKFFGRGVLNSSTQNVFKRMIASGVESGTAMGLQTGVVGEDQAYALRGLGLDAPTDEEIGRSALEQGLMGAAVGGVLGIRPHAPEAVPQVRAYRPDEIGRLGRTPVDAQGTRAAEPPPKPESEVYRGRPSDVPPGQTPSPEVDVDKRAAAQARHDEPVSGRNVSIEGTGRMGLKPDAETRPAAETARDETVSTVSSPVADDQQVAMEATQGNWMTDRWNMIRAIKAANPEDTRSYNDFLKMNRADLTAEHSKLPAVKEPEAPARVEPPVEQPPAQPAAAQAPTRPDVTANLPVGGDVTPAGDFATGPVGEAGSMLPPDRDVERELARYDELQQAQQGAQPQPEARPTVEPQPRGEPSLQAVKPEVIGEGLAEAVQSRERIAAAQAAEEAALREKGGVGGKNWMKKQIAFREANNKVADEIVGRHQLTKDSKDWLAPDPHKAGGRGSLAAMISRLRGMVEDADRQRKAGRFTPPQEFNWIDHPKMPNHSPSVLAIDEARRFLKNLVKYKDAQGKTIEGVHERDDITRHLDREWRLTAPHLSAEEKLLNYRKLLPERVSEAEEMMAKQERGPRAGERPFEEGEEERIAAPEKEKEEEVAAEPEGQVKARETIQKLLEPIPHHPTGEDATREDWFKWKQAILDHALAEHVMKSPRVEELNPKGLTPWSDKMLKFETYMRQFQDATRERAAKLPAVKEEPKPAVKEEPKPPTTKEKLQAGLEARLPTMKPTAEGIPARLNDGNLGYVKSWKDGVIKDWLSKIKGENPPELKGLAPALLNKIINNVGDMPTHLLKNDEMNKIAPEGTRGKYDMDLERIYINTDQANPTTVFHEAFHAATVRGILADEELQDHLHQLWKEANPNALPLRGSVLRSTVEWLTYLMTDKGLQEDYKAKKISPELAKTLGIAPWRKKTIFEGVLNVIRKALGFGPRDTGVIEAALALSERAMERTELATKGTEPTAFYQRDMDTPERMQEAFLKSPTEKFNSIKNLEGKVAVQHAKDMALNVGTGFIKGTAKLLSMDKLDMIHGKVAPFIRPVSQMMNKIHHLYTQGREEDQDIRLRSYLLEATHRNEADDYDQLTRMMKQFQIDPTGGTAKAGSIRAYFAPRVQELYNRLSPENQTRSISEMKQYQKYRKDSGLLVLKNILTVYGVPDGSTTEGFITRAKADELTTEDRRYFRQQGGEERLRAAMEQLRGKEIYSNTVRSGNWVQFARFFMPEGGETVDAAGTKLADDMREFDTEAEANKYATEGNPYGLHPTVRSAYYGNDPETGNYIRMTKEDAEQVAPAGQKPDQKFQVKLERDWTEMAKSPAEARRFREEMLKHPGVDQSTVTYPMDKRKDQTWAHISPADQRLYEQRINKLNIPQVQKEQMIQASRESMLSSQAGGLLGKHKIQRRNVLGGQSGSAEALDAYSRMHYHAMAQAEVAPQLSTTLDYMDKHEKDNQTAPDATRRSIINNEVRERLLSQQPMQSKSSVILRNLMNYSFLNFLLRPSHVFLQQMHPWIYSVPALMARHGWAAIKGQQQAMRDLGGDQSMVRLKMLKKGAQAAWGLRQALREKDIDKAVELAKGWNPIKEMIGNLKDKDERDAMNRLWEGGAFHNSFDTSILEGNGFDRQAAMLGQLTNTMEAANRLPTALNAYRLEKAAHDSHFNAIDYAQRTIESTMGVYTPTNVAPIFRNPLMKPIMQFHQMPINLAISLYNNMYKALPEKLGGEANAEARKTLAYQLGTAFAFGGMGGMPMDIPKVAGLASQALGGPAPSEYDNKFREELNNLVGPTMANVIEEGLPSLAGPFGPSLGHRMGFNTELLFGEPASGSTADIGSWIGSNLAGASASTIAGWHNTLLSLEAGEYEKAAEDVLPGSARDLFKAYREATQGTFAGPRQVKEASVAQGLMQAFGFQTLEQERAWEGHYALQKEIRAEKTDRSGVLQKGTIGDVMRWNALHPMDRITPAEMQRARHPQPGQQVLGVKVPKWIPPARAREYQQVYGS